MSAGGENRNNRPLFEISPNEVGPAYFIRTDGPSYLWPVDELSINEADLWQEFWLKLRDDRRWTVPIPMNKEGLRLLDVGCGPGTWSYDIAYNHCPNAHVVAVDLIMQGPLEIPENLEYQEIDVNSPWPNRSDQYFDIVYMRRMAGCVRSWAHVYAGIFRQLKPEHGWMEHLEVDFQPRSDLPQIAPGARDAFDEMLSAMDEYGYSMRFEPNVNKNLLEAAGFVDVREEVFDMPLSEWTEDEERNEIGRYLNLAITGRLADLLRGPLMIVKRRTEKEVADTTLEAKKDIFKKATRLYMRVYAWTARRPA